MDEFLGLRHKPLGLANSKTSSASNNRSNHLKCTATTNHGTGIVDLMQTSYDNTQQKCKFWFFQTAGHYVQLQDHQPSSSLTCAHHNQRQANSIMNKTRPSIQQHSIIMDKVIGLNNSSIHHHHSNINHQNHTRPAWQTTGYSAFL